MHGMCSSWKTDEPSSVLCRWVLNQDNAEIVAGLMAGEQFIRYPGNELEAGWRVGPSGSCTGS